MLNYKKTIVAFLCASLCSVALAIKVVHVAQYLNDKGDVVTVTTFDDGSMKVSVLGIDYKGLEAMRMLSSYGITLTVSSSGRILGQELSDDVKVMTKPHRPMPGEVTGDGKLVEKNTDQTKTQEAEQRMAEAAYAAGESAMPSSTPGSSFVPVQPYVPMSDRDVEPWSPSQK